LTVPFVGKQIGVFLTTWVAVKLDWADCPEGASWAQVYGVSLLCGIGFTMSLFVGLLAFPASPELQDAVKIGVLSGSVLSAVVGTLILAFAPCERPQRAVVQKS
jgi:NhaA family Na+:H+ antiporter